MSQKKLPTEFNSMAVTQFGAPSVLQLITCDMPVIGSGEVVIKSIAASVNPIDYKTRAGLGWAAQQNKDRLPFVLGYDCFGEVVATADDCSALCIGDKVLGLVGFPLQAGAYGEYVICKQHDVVRVDKSHTSALSALPVAGLTAMQGLFEFGQLSSNETVLISGAAGAVGYLAVQLALQAGATVIAIANANDHAMLATLGDLTFIDYNALKGLDSIANVDLWFDLIGGQNAMTQLSKVASIKRLVTVPTITATEVCATPLLNGTNAQGMLINKDVEMLRNLALMVENCQLKLNIAKYMNVRDAALAHQQIEQGEIKGKVVLEFEW